MPTSNPKRFGSAKSNVKSLTKDQSAHSLDGCPSAEVDPAVQQPASRRTLAVSLALVGKSIMELELSMNARDRIDWDAIEAILETPGDDF